MDRSTGRRSRRRIRRPALGAVAAVVVGVTAACGVTTPPMVAPPRPPGEVAAEAWDTALAATTTPPLLITEPLSVLDGGGWTDAESKDAWVHGRLVVEDPAGTGTPAPQTIALGGTTRTVGVLSPDATAASVRRGDRCAADCRELVLTDPALVTMRITTILGPTDVPAWQFVAQGTPDLVRLVAIDPAEYLTVPDVTGLPSLWTAEVLAGGTVRVSFPGETPPSGHGCGSDDTASAAETEHVVVVDVIEHADLSWSGAGCAGPGVTRTVDLPLDRPLGDRVLVAAEDGAVIGIDRRADH
ncbi:hypothetical protein [Nakamurella leprariae]|uniref:Uncharacterized protein n=1 Tax=Nakamurella leprariae TaxID=2803911 RepID=A0A938YJ76_9ACTN|nr:hypothetical protein [Nakamurella leprariae]MBM9469139.1 hypothetical protein [Nakamurella leprariae]